MARSIAEEMQPGREGVRAGSQPALADLDVSRQLHRAALIGLSGSVAVAFAASIPGSPFSLQRTGAWFFGTTHVGSGGVAFGAVVSTHAFAAAGWGRRFDLLLGVVGVLLVVRAWLSLCRLTRRHSVAVRSLAKVLALWAVPLLVAPPIFSGDIYSYAAQAELVSRHINPYRYGPAVLGATPFATLAQGVWANAPSPYGPLILGIEAGFVNLAHHNVLATLVLLRLVAVAGVVASAALVPVVARQRGHDPGAAFALAVLNPLVIFFLIGSGHNDSLMAAFLLAGLAALGRNRAVLAVVLCTMAGAVKDPALAGVVFVGWAWAGPGASLRRRAEVLAWVTVIAVVTMEALSWMSGLGWGWLATVGTPASVSSWLAPVSVVAAPVGGVLHLMGLGGAASGVTDLIRVAALGFAAVVGFRLLRRSSSEGAEGSEGAEALEGPVVTLGLALLVLVALSPVSYPWYLTWGLLPLAAVAQGPLRSLALTVPVLGTVAGMFQAGVGAAWALGVLPNVVLAVVGVATVYTVMVSVGYVDPASGGVVGALGSPRHLNAVAGSLEGAR